MGLKGGWGGDGQWYGMVGDRRWCNCGSKSGSLLFGGYGMGDDWGIVCGLGFLVIVVGSCCSLEGEFGWRLVWCMDEYCFCCGIVCGVPLLYRSCLRVPGSKRHFQLSGQARSNVQVLYCLRP